MRRSIRILFVAIVLTLSARPAKAAEVFCYVETLWGGARVSDLDLSVCTHVVDAFVVPDDQGKLTSPTGVPRRALVEAAHAAGAKALLAVGGATTGAARFAAIAGDAARRTRFADDLARMVIEGGYDGADLDWEFPDKATRDLHLELCRVVRARLDAAVATARPGKKAILVIGVSPAAHLEGYDFAALSKVVDFFVHYGYDFRNPALGPWAHTVQFWPDDATQPIEASVRGAATEIVKRGVPRARLIIALPMYASDGRPWSVVRHLPLGPLDPTYLENPIAGSDVWVTGPAALEAKIHAALFGKDIDGGAAGGIGLWQLGHLAGGHDLTDAVRRALRP